MKIGFISLPLSGHLHPMTALAHELQTRGHEVVFFGVPDAEPAVLEAGLEFVTCCAEEYPVGSVPKVWGPIASLHGLDPIRYSFGKIHPAYLQAAYQDIPHKLVETGVQALLIDTAVSFFELVPMGLKLPYIQVWCVLHPDPSGATPLSLFSWPNDSSPAGLERNREALKQFGALFAPTLPIAQAYAERVGLTVNWADPGATSSTLAVIVQTPKAFDFPNIQLPPQWHHAGPLQHNESRKEIDFPWDTLNCQPLIYASLGTVTNGLPQIHDAILGAARQLPDVQFVFSTGGAMDPASFGTIPPNVLLIPVAPQLELLKRAALCITHAGLNTALECLSQGVPMVAIPIGYDQPGVASRIAYHHVGEFVEVDDLTAANLLDRIQRVLSDSSYRDNALQFQKIFEAARGLDKAADIVEEAFGTAAQL